MADLKNDISSDRRNAVNDLLKKQYPFPSYNFCMIFNAIPVGFKKISGVTLAKENYKPFQEGGVNNFLAIHKNERTELNKLVLEKGVGFYNPVKLLGDFLYLMILAVFDDNHKLIHAYAFSKGVVSDVVVSDFNAMESKALIESITIMYDFAEAIDFSGRAGMIDFAANLFTDTAGFGEENAKYNIEKIKAHNEQVKEKAAEKAKEAEEKKNKENQKLQERQKEIEAQKLLKEQKEEERLKKVKEHNEKIRSDLKKSLAEQAL